MVGIGEAAFHMASLIAGKFSVVTTLSRSVPAIEHNLVRYGLASRCARVRASDVPVLELEVPGSNARQRISEEIERAIRDDRAEAIVLGCAGMADLAANAQPRTWPSCARRRRLRGKTLREPRRPWPVDLEARRLPGSTRKILRRNLCALFAPRPCIAACGAKLLTFPHRMFDVRPEMRCSRRHAIRPLGQ